MAKEDIEISVTYIHTTEAVVAKAAIEIDSTYIHTAEAVVAKASIEIDLTYIHTVAVAKESIEIKPHLYTRAEILLNVS